MTTYSLIDDYAAQKSIYTKLADDGIIFANPTTRRAVVAFQVPPSALHEASSNENPNGQTVIYEIEPYAPSSWDDLGFWSIVQNNGKNKILYEGKWLAAKQALPMIDDFIGSNGCENVLLSLWAY